MPISVTPMHGLFIFPVALMSHSKFRLSLQSRSARYWRVAQTRNLWRHVNGVRDEVICKQDLNSDTYMNKLHTLFLTWCPFGNCDGIRTTLKCRKDSLPRHFFVVLQFSFFQIKKRLCWFLTGCCNNFFMCPHFEKENKQTEHPFSPVRKRRHVS